MTEPNGLQDDFLNHIFKENLPVTLFLINGVKLQGYLTGFDRESVLLRREGHVQLVYKHALSTVMPVAALTDFPGSTPKI